MADTSPNLLLPYIQPAQAQKHVTHNAAIARLDTLTQLRLEQIGATTPPALPEAGQVFALGSGATGDWAGQDGTLALYSDNAWVFETPQDGWHAVDLDTGALVVWRMGVWQAPAGNATDTLGINTSADTTNRLAVASDASLFTHAGTGHQLKVNKAAATDTGSLLFQTAFSGRAEMGLAGEDNWSVKVSPDGAAWQTALRIDAATGAVGVGPDAGTAYQFSVAAASIEPTILVHNTGGIGGATVRMIDDNSGSDWKFKTTGAGDFKLRNQTAGIDQIILRGTTNAVDFAGPVRPASYTVATLPAAATVKAGAMVYVSDASGGDVIAFSDGSAWRRMNDRSVVS